MFILERSLTGFNFQSLPAEVIGVVVGEYSNKEELLNYVRSKVTEIEDRRSGPGMKIEVIGIEEIKNKDLRKKIPSTYEIAIIYDDGGELNRARYVRNTFRLRHVEVI